MSEKEIRHVQARAATEPWRGVPGRPVRRPPNGQAKEEGLLKAGPRAGRAGHVPLEIAYTVFVVKASSSIWQHRTWQLHPPISCGGADGRALDQKAAITPLLPTSGYQIPHTR